MDHPVFRIFREISAIPRCSGHEDRIAAWVMARAGEKGLASSRDKAGNVVVRVPAASGCEIGPPVILQSHLDMVCEKTPESNHDFSCDPLSLVVEASWLRAAGTTLGADNGIGMALSLALAEETGLRRPGLELLFTVEEETGLTGARNLDTSLLKGRLLVNIDSEEEGTLTIGCAGGENAHMEFPVTRRDIPRSYILRHLDVGGLQGGHSGMNIGENRGNANKIITRLLEPLVAEMPCLLVSLAGGTRSNVIPRQAKALLALPADSETRVRSILAETAGKIHAEFRGTEPRLAMELAPAEREEKPPRAFADDGAQRLIRLLAQLPHGVRQWSTELENSVETSNNLAIVQSEDEAVKILCFQRSSDMEKLQALTTEIGELATQHGARFQRDGLYPGWQPNLNSPLLAHCRKTYEQLHNREARVAVTHGGLECGILGHKMPHLDMISLGPDIENPHSPGERAYIPSVLAVYDFLRTLLPSFAR